MARTFPWVGQNRLLLDSVSFGGVDGCRSRQACTCRDADSISRGRFRSTRELRSGAILERRIKRWSRGLHLDPGGFILLEPRPASKSRTDSGTMRCRGGLRRSWLLRALSMGIGAFWSSTARPARSIYERNADQLFAPASVTKLFSTAAALIELGPGYRFQTPLVRHGEVDAKGKLHGRIDSGRSGRSVHGRAHWPRGHACCSRTTTTRTRAAIFEGEIVATNPLAGLDHLAREVRPAGIREITGDVIVDDRLFAPAVATGSGPSRVSPIVINDNVIDVLARPAGKAGEPASVTIQPATQFVTIDAAGRDGRGGQARRRSTVERVGPQRFAVRGQLPLGHAQVVKIGEIEHPASFARALDRGPAAARGAGRGLAARVEQRCRAASARRGDQVPQGC